MHGFPDEPGGFRPQADWLVQRGHRVLAPYLPGYYAAESCTEWCSGGGALGAEVALSCWQMLDALGEPRIHLLIGHDWGALVSYSMVVARPDSVDRLVAAAVPYGGRMVEAFLTDPAQQLRSWYMFFFQMPFAELAVGHDNFAFIDRLWRVWSPSWNYAAADIDAVKSLFAQPEALSAALTYYRLNLNPAAPAASEAGAELRGRVGSAPLPCPTLYVHGAEDGCIGAEYAEQDASLYPTGLSVQILPKAGHFVHREAPAAFNQAVGDWLDR
ncbi:MAG: alpha/beta hydrolase [Gammaproteobacteria bacterium AqS3]|nr:alpha/beta hydrolase [Gammaproteobacteria bacterium AqS3]